MGWSPTPPPKTQGLLGNPRGKFEGFSSCGIQGPGGPTGQPNLYDPVLCVDFV